MKKKYLTLTSLLALAAAVTLPVLAEGDGWVSLFDGKTLEGWTIKSGKATYKVEDGAILGRTEDGSPNTFLCSAKEYGDFELEFDVKVDNGLNSGVQIRSTLKDVDKDQYGGRVTGPQVEIEAGPGQAGFIYGEATPFGWLSPKPKANEKDAEHPHFKNGEWNHYRIVAKGTRIQTWINGEAIEDLAHEEIYKTNAKGFIGLQVHGIGKGSGPFEVRWKNLKIKELN